jgi:RimJ/RimL family protein N-acetyltransferase
VDRLELLNHVANQPEVLHACAPGLDELRLDAFFDEPKNIMLGNELGLILFMYIADFGHGGVYEFHYLLTKALRGRKALLAARMALSAVFRERGAAAVYGSTPAQNLGARAMNRALGAVPASTTEDNFARPCIRYVLTREAWEKWQSAQRLAKVAEGVS